MSIGSFLRGFFHGGVDVLAGAGMGLGALLGAIGAGGSELLSLATFGHVKIFSGGFKHTVLSSALGWGSLFAILSPSVRVHFVGPAINQAAGAIAGSAAWGDEIPADDVGKGPTPGTEVVSVPASWGLRGKMTVHDFIGPVIAEPYTEITVPASSYSNGVLTVTPGIAGALRHR